MNQTCAKCHSEKIIPDATVIDRGDYSVEDEFSVAVDEKPDALMFKKRMRSDVGATVCGDCGYVEFYAKEPQNLYAAYQNKLRNSG